MAAAAPPCSRRRASSLPGGLSLRRRRVRIVLGSPRFSWNITSNTFSKHRRAVKAPLKEELYEVFISEMEEAKSTEFHAFFGSEAAVSVPGQTNRDLHLKLSDPARLSCAAMIDWLLLLEKAGYTLSGCFSTSDFALTHFGKFKGKGLLLQNVKRLRMGVKKGMDTAADMARAAYLIEAEICSGVQILPADLQDLLDKLRHFNKKDIFIIKHHCSLYNDIEKEMLFSSMYTRFKKLEKIDRAKWQRIISKIPYCKCLHQWKSSIQMNTHLTSVFTKKPLPSIHSKKYKEGVKERLWYLRHCQAHISDLSVDTVSSGCSAQPQMEFYCPDDAEHTLVALPDLLAEFQSAMNGEGEVKRLGWHEPSMGRRLKE